MDSSTEALVSTPACAPGGGGHSGTQGGRTLVTYFAEEGVFF